MVSPINYDLHVVVSNHNVFSQQKQFSSIETEKGDQAPSLEISKKLPLPPEESDITAIVRNLKESIRTPLSSTSSKVLENNSSISENIEMQNPYGHETADSNPPTPVSTSSECSMDDDGFYN